MKTKVLHIHILVSFVLLYLLFPQTASASEREITNKTIISESFSNTICYASREENELPAIPLPGQQKQKRGDADGNGIINYRDALLVLRYSIGLENLSKAVISRCDVDNSGQINYRDALLILRYSIGLESSL